MQQGLWSNIAPGILGIGMLIGLLAPESALAQSAANTAKATGAPVVVELFTSQGCSSCPPADAFLGDLSQRDDVIALAYHVDYWNRLGWVDRFSSKWATELQSAYSRAHGRRSNYTPQMVIHGVSDKIGSRRNDVLEAIAIQQSKARPAVKVSIQPKGDAMLRIEVAGMDHAVEAEIVLLRYHRKEQQVIGRGENGGRTLDYHNIVHERRVLGRWRGEAASFDIPKPEDPSSSGLAVLVQARNQGPILGAGKI